MSKDEEKLAELESRAEALRLRLDELQAEADKLRKQRDELNQAVKEIRAEAIRLREKRDKANTQVAEIKLKMEPLRSKVKDMRARLAEMNAEVEKARRGLPPRRKLAGKLGRIEWEIMTTPTVQMLDREGEMIEESRDLRKELSAHEELDKREDGGLLILAEIKSTELELLQYRSEIERIRQISAESHEKMINSIREAEGAKERADEAHARFKELLEAKKPILGELNEVKRQVKELKLKLRERDRMKSAGREVIVEEKRKKLVAESRQKLEAGKKLSFEEMKLIYESEEEE